jgi:LPS export ABC transporter protein LptC
MKGGAAVLLLGALLLSAGCNEKPMAKDDRVLPNQITDSLTVHESRSGGRLYTLEAESAYVFDADQRAEVVRPRVTFYDEAGAVNSRLSADAGTIYSQSEDLVARGNVVVVTAESTHLLTDSLSWSNGRQVVSTDAPVEIATPKGVIRGQGLLSDAGLSRVQILSEVRGTSSYNFNTYK